MAYQIQYGQTAKRITIADNSKKIKPQFLRTLILVTVVLLCLYALKTDAVQDLVIPGDKEVTKAAFTQLTEDLKQGQPFVQAFTDFCHEVVHKDAYT